MHDVPLMPETAYRGSCRILDSLELEVVIMLVIRMVILEIQLFPSSEKLHINGRWEDPCRQLVRVVVEELWVAHGGWIATKKCDGRGYGALAALVKIESLVRLVVVVPVSQAGSQAQRIRRSPISHQIHLEMLRRGRKKQKSSDPRHDPVAGHTLRGKREWHA